MANLSSIITPSNVLTATNTQTLTNKTIDGANNTITNVGSLSTTNFKIEESGGKLIIKYGATTIASISSAGLLTALSDVTSNGTP
jgi:hypothetical protein